MVLFEAKSSANTVGTIPFRVELMKLGKTRLNSVAFANTGPRGAPSPKMALPVPVPRIFVAPALQPVQSPSGSLAGRTEARPVPALR